MDRALIEEKLESLRRCLTRIKDKTPVNVDELVKNVDLQDIITLNLTRAVQLSVDIAAHWVADLDGLEVPGTMGGIFDVLAQNENISQELAQCMKASVGFRNIAVHNYEVINWQVVYAICEHHMDDFSNFAKVVYSALITQNNLGTNK